MKIHGTAKGGALSKKDFGVAFGGGGGSSLLSEQTIAEWSNTSPNLQGYIYKLDTSVYYEKTITSFTIKHGNNDGNASGSVTLSLYNVPSNGFDPAVGKIGDIGTQDVPSGTTTEDVTFDTTPQEVPAVGAGGAWLLLSLANVTNAVNYVVYGVDPPENSEPAEYDPWLAGYKFKDDNSVSATSTNWYYSISGY